MIKMNNPKPNSHELGNHKLSAANASQADADRPVELLELFAEELPEQHDPLPFACASCCGTFGGSTVGTASCFSTY